MSERFKVTELRDHKIYCSIEARGHVSRRRWRRKRRRKRREEDGRDKG